MKFVFGGAIMNIRNSAVGTALLLSLAGCGGGGSGGVSSTPTPTPAPVPTNATLMDLKYSQSFTNDAALLTGSWDLTTSTVFDGTAQRSNLTISYDAKSGGYTLSANGRSQTFIAADITSQDNYDTVYKKSAASGSDYLTLVKTPYSGGSGPQNVAMGFWQHNATADSRQSVEFASFTYGLPTATAMVPRTGSAAYGIDVFGLVTMPGEEPRSFQGAGQFDIDFLQGIFTTQTYVTEYAQVSGAGTSGGGIELRAGGSLSSSDGTFSGNAVHGSSYGQSSGTIEGRFYGSNGQELGATFQTGDAGGLAAVGSLVGSKNGSLTPANQSLTGLTHEQLFYTRGGSLIGQLTWLNSETFTFSPPVSDMGGGRFTINDKVVSGGPNFTTYAKLIDSPYGSQQVVLELYKSGAANTELALTYACFGHWAGTRGGSTQDHYFTYGFATGGDFLTARTGTARYEGTIYGTGVNSDASAKYDVNGTSAFNIDFADQTFSGALSLAGVEQTSGANVNFGSFDVDGSLSTRDSSLTGDVSRGGANVGSLWAQFYGPDAQELAGTFWVNAPAGSGESREVGIQGATVAARK